jgi:hypothetical protein
MSNGPVLVAKLGWRLTEHGRERTCERLMSLVSGIKRNFGDGLTGEPQAVCGALEPQAPNMLFDRFADHSAEYPVKMEGRKGRDTGQFFKRNRTVQILLNVYEYLQDATLVVLKRAIAHGSTSIRVLLSVFQRNAVHRLAQVRYYPT